MDAAKALVVFYSRTGITQRAAAMIAEALGADLEELRERQSRAGVAGWLGAGRDAALGRRAALEPAAKDPAAYGLVVVGAPVWAFTAAPPARTYVVQMKDRLPRAAFFATMDGAGGERACRRLAEAAGKAPVATLALLSKAVASETCREDVAAFVGKLRAPAAR